jgi:hypothetical protein
MTVWLVDTSILARLANADDIAHQMAADAVQALISRGDVLRTSPQNLNVQHFARPASLVPGLTVLHPEGAIEGK